MEGVTILTSVPSSRRGEMAELLYEAFLDKFTYALRPQTPEHAKRAIAAGIRMELAIAALSENGEILGIAGLSGRTRLFLDIPFRVLVEEVGWFAGLRMKVVALTERMTMSPGRSGERIEILAVRSDARGRGIGTLLLESAARDARSRGTTEMSLEVVDTNPRARQLYTRVGFRCVKTLRMGLLTAGAGFRELHVMRRQLDEDAVDDGGSGADEGHAPV